MKTNTYIFFYLFIFVFLCSTHSFGQDCLISHYRFDNNLLDTGPSQFNILSSRNIIFTSDRHNEPNKSIQFNGQDSYIISPSAYDYRELTITFWFKTMLVDNQIRCIFNSDNPTNIYGRTAIYQQATNGRKDLIYGKGNQYSTGDSAEIKENEWYFVGYVTTQDSVYYYLNCKLIGAFPISYYNSPDGITSAIMGADRKFTRYFKGAVDDVKVYDCPLSHEEILNEYYSSKNIASSPFGDTLTIGVLANTAIQIPALNLPSGEFQIKWDHKELLDNNSIPNPTVNITEDSVILTATVVDPERCFEIYFVRVLKIIDIAIPNVFSPQGDLKNDNFSFIAKNIPIQNIKIKEFRIYSRWGQLVYNNETPLIGWDGNYKGIPQPSDIYIYYLALELPNGESLIKKGDIVLLR